MKSIVFTAIIIVFTFNQSRAQEILTKVDGGASWQNINQTLISARVELNFDHTANHTSFTKIRFDNEVFDAGGNNYDNSSGSIFYEAPDDGFYRIDYSLGIIFDGPNMGDQLHLNLVKDPFVASNPIEILARNVVTGVTSSTDPNFQLTGSIIISAAQGDRLWLEANRTGSTNGDIKVASGTHSHLTFTKL